MSKSKESKAEDKGSEQTTPPESEEVHEVATDESIAREDNLDFEPLFDGEGMTPSDLGDPEAPLPKEGEEEAKAEEKEKVEAKKEPEEKEKVESEKESEKEPEEKEKAEAKKEPEAKEKGKKPPKGYVPQEALHESREIIKEMRDEMSALQSEVASLKVKDADETKDSKAEADFVVLSDSEFEELLEDDPIEAIKYERRLKKYEEEKDKETDAERQERVAVQSSVDKMKSFAPELFEPGNDTVDKLLEFATGSGFEQQYLTVLTDPATRLLLPDSKRPGKTVAVPLGDGAVSLVKMLVNLHKTSNDKDPDAFRSEIRAELEAEFAEKEKELAQKLVTKFKSNPEGIFRDIGEIPGSSGDEPSSPGKTLSEKEFAKLSEEEQEKYLGA